MKRTFACLLMLLLLYALPVLGEVTGFPGRVCEGAPLLSISIVDTARLIPPRMIKFCARISPPKMGVCRSRCFIGRLECP